MVFITRSESRRRQGSQRKSLSRTPEFTKLTTKAINIKSENKQIDSKTKSSNDPGEISESVSSEIVTPRSLRKKACWVMKEMSNVIKNDLENTGTAHTAENMSEITGSEMKDGDPIINTPPRKTRASKANMESLQTKETPSKEDFTPRRSARKSTRLGSENLSVSFKDSLKAHKQLKNPIVSIDENVEGVDSVLHSKKAQTENDDVSESAAPVTEVKLKQDKNILSPVQKLKDSDITNVDILQKDQSTPEEKITKSRSTRKSAIKDSENMNNFPKSPEKTNTKLVKIPQYPDIVLILDSQEVQTYSNKIVAENKSQFIETEPKQDGDTIPPVQNTEDSGVTKVDNLQTTESLSTICTPRRSTRKSVINTSENTNITAENLQKASVPVKSPGKDSVPVKSPGKDSVPVKSPGKDSVPVKSPGKYSVPVKSPGKDSVPVKSPGKDSVPVKSPGKDSVPVKSPGKDSVPVKSPGKDSVPVKSPGKASVPVKSPGKASVPVKSPGKASVPVKSPGKASVPVKSPGKASVPVKSPGKASVPVKSPGKASVPVKSPGKASVPVKSPGKASVPVKSPGKASVPVKSPGKASVPVKSPGKASVPVKSPGKDSVPVKSPGKDSVPVKSPGKDSAPVKSPGKASAPVKSPGKASAPVKSPGKASAPVKSPGKASAPVKSPGKASAAVKSPGKASAAAKSPGKASAAVKSPGKASALMESSGKVSAPSKIPGKVSAPSKIPGNASAPVKSPGKASAPVEIPARTNTRLSKVIESPSNKNSISESTENSNQFVVLESAGKENNKAAKPVSQTDKLELENGGAGNKIIDKETAVENVSKQNVTCDTKIREKNNLNSLGAENFCKRLDKNDSSVNSLHVQLPNANSDINFNKASQISIDDIDTSSNNTESTQVSVEKSMNVLTGKSSSVKDSETTETFRISETISKNDTDQKSSVEQHLNSVELQLKHGLSGESTTDSHYNIPIVEAIDKIISPIFQQFTSISKDQELGKNKLKKKKKEEKISLVLDANCELKPVRKEVVGVIEESNVEKNLSLPIDGQRGRVKVVSIKVEKKFSLPIDEQRGLVRVVSVEGVSTEKDDKRKSKTQKGKKSDKERTPNKKLVDDVVIIEDDSPVEDNTTSPKTKKGKNEESKENKGLKRKLADCVSTEKDLHRNDNAKKSPKTKKRKKSLNTGEVKNNDVSAKKILPTDNILKLSKTKKGSKSKKPESPKTKLAENDKRNSPIQDNTIKPSKTKKGGKEESKENQGLKRKLDAEDEENVSRETSSNAKKKRSKGILVIQKLPESVEVSDIKTLFSENKIKLKKQKMLKVGGAIVQLKDWSEIGKAVSLLSENYLGKAICINSLKDDGHDSDQHVNESNQSPTHEKMADVVITEEEKCKFVVNNLPVNCKLEDLAKMFPAAIAIKLYSEKRYAIVKNPKEAAPLSDKNIQKAKVDDSCVNLKVPNNVKTSKPSSQKKACSRLLYIEGNFKQFTLSKLSIFFDGKILLKKNGYIVVKFKDIKTAKKHFSELMKFTNSNGIVKVKYLPKLK